MTFQFVHHSPCACAHMLMWILVATATWRPSCAFDFFNGRHVGPQRAHQGSALNMHRDSSGNWQPSSIWWRSRRSVPPGFHSPSHVMPPALSSLPVLSRFEDEKPTSSLLPLQDNEVLPLLMEEAEDARHNKHLLLQKLKHEFDDDDDDNDEQFGISGMGVGRVGHSPGRTISKSTLPLNKMLMKMRLVSEIKQALRRRHKFENAERGLERLEALDSPAYKAAHQLQEMHNLEKEKAMVRQQKTIKSRRAKMGLHTQGVHPAHKVAAPNFPEVEWFPDPVQHRPHQPLPTFDEYVLPSSKNTAFHGQPVGSFGSPINSDSFSMFPADAPLSGGFSDVPFKDFQGDSMVGPPGSFSSSFDTGSTESRPLKQEDEFLVGFFEGGFDNGDKDCDTISTKTCFSDADCSCHGFYECAQGRCDIKGNKKPPSRDTWHDEPIDFGFIKRQADDNKMADIEDSKGETKH